MSTVVELVTAFHTRFEQAETSRQRRDIAAQYHEYYNQLSETDRLIARETTRPFLKRAVQQLKEEGEPLLQQAEELLDRIRQRSTTPTL